MNYNRKYNLFSACFVAILLITSSTVTKAQNKVTYQPTSNFDTFWSQVREAFLNPSPKAIAALTQGGKFRLRGELLGLDMNNKCLYEAGKAYLTTLQKSLAGGRYTTWKTFLTKHPKLDINNDSSVTRGGLGEYRVHLKVSFVQGKKDKKWYIEELTDDIDRFYKWSKGAGGPAKCN